MKYAYGLVDKNNIIRTVEDIMCAGNDTSHETITDFKQEITDKVDEIPDHIEEAIKGLLIDQLPDQYYNREETDNQIKDKINEYNSDITINYATKSFVNTTKNNILAECEQSFYTKGYINDHIISTIEFDEEIEPLKTKIKELEDRIKVLEGTS